MRTTVTLDPDVEALLQIAMKERRLSFKDALNAAVRLGLTGSKTRRRNILHQSLALGSDESEPLAETPLK